MSRTEMLIRLRDLHEELSGINFGAELGEHVDQETIEALGQLVTDIGELVDQAKSAAGDEVIDNGRKSLLDRVVEFDQNHPRVKRFLAQTTDLLAMLGI